MLDRLAFGIGLLEHKVLMNFGELKIGDSLISMLGSQNHVSKAACQFSLINTGLPFLFVF